MDARITIGLVAALLLLSAAPASAHEHQSHPNGDGCYLEHDYGGCWLTVGDKEVAVCLYTPDGCPPPPISVPIR